jgi:hypothetical protein
MHKGVHSVCPLKPGVTSPKEKRGGNKKLEAQKILA